MKKVSMLDTAKAPEAQTPGLFVHFGKNHKMEISELSALNF